MKELQSLCLDIQVLDENMEVIELADDDEDDTDYVRPIDRAVSDKDTDDDFNKAGFEIRDIEEDDGEDSFDDIDDGLDDFNDLDNLNGLQEEDDLDE